MKAMSEGKTEITRSKEKVIAAPKMSHVVNLKEVNSIFMSHRKICIERRLRSSDTHSQKSCRKICHPIHVGSTLDGSYYLDLYT